MMKDIKPDLASASASNYQTWTPSIAQHLITGDSTITSTSYDENCSQGIDYSYEQFPNSLITSQPLSSPTVNSPSSSSSSSSSSSLSSLISVSTTTCHYSSDSTTTTINQVRLDQTQTDSTTASEGIKKRKTGKSSYKHIPHREKPPHLVARRNARERRRVQAVNSAFATLRKHVNEPNRNKRLSKVKTLQKAIEYIAYLQGLLSEGDNVTMNVNTNVTANQHYQQSDNNNSMMQLISPGSIVNGVNTVNNANNNNEINSGHSIESTIEIKLINGQSLTSPLTSASNETYINPVYCTSPKEILICENINKENIVDTKWIRNDNIHHNHHSHHNHVYGNNNSYDSSCVNSYYQPFHSNVTYDGYSQVTN